MLTELSTVTATGLMPAMASMAGKGISESVANALSQLSDRLSSLDPSQMMAHLSGGQALASASVAEQSGPAATAVVTGPSNGRTV